MKTSNLLFVFLMLYALMSVDLYGETVISDSTDVRGTWTKANSPYIIEGTAFVQHFDTLRIEPGVEVKFNIGTDFNTFSENFDATSLIVKGVLEAMGTESQKIVFTRNGDEGYWGNIQIRTDREVQSILKNCIIEYTNRIDYSTYSSSEDNSYGALNLHSDNVFFNRLIVDSCIIRFGGYDALYIIKSEATVHNSLIHNNAQSGIKGDHLHGDIRNNKIYDNGSIGIYLTDYSQPSIWYNTISGNSIGVYVVSSSHPSHVIGNIIENNTGNGYYSATDYTQNNFIENILRQNNINLYMVRGTFNAFNNVITGAKEWAIYCGGNKYSGNLNAINNSIINNHGGVKTTSKGTLNLTSSIWWNNGIHENSGLVNLQNSLIDNATIEEGMVDLGENLFGIDPLLSDTANDDFSLLPGSPAIDAGYIDTSVFDLPDVDFIGNPRLSNGRIDMGAYEFQQTGKFVKLVYPYSEQYIVSNLWYTIRWQTSNPEEGTDILLSTDNGKTWSQIENNNTTNEYRWFTPELISDSCLLLLRNSSDYSVVDTSTYLFRISPNYIPSDISIYGTWIQEYSPYKVFGPITVPSDSTLIIEPGVCVQFSEETSGTIYKNGGSILAEGRIIAEGTSDNKILFTTMDKNAYWGNIKIAYWGNPSTIRNCIFENGGKYREGMLEISMGNNVEFNIFRNSYGNGLYLNYGDFDVPVSNNIFHSNKASGIYVYTRTTINRIYINNSVFYNNNVAVRNGYKVKISNSIFAENTLDILHDGENAILAYCLFDKHYNQSDLDSTDHCLYAANPKFVDVDTFDFHLRSNSPGIDAGNPDDEFNQEPEPNGGRINLGIYGNTNEATKSPVFKLNKYDFSAMGYDTLTLYKNDLGSTRGVGNVKINGVITEIVNWFNDSLIFVTPTSKPGTYDMTLTDAAGNHFPITNFIDCHAPEIISVHPFYGIPSGGEEIEIKGTNLGKNLQNLIVDNELVAISSWSDTLIRFTTNPHAEGNIDLILQTSDLVFADTTVGAFQYFSVAPENLCSNLPNILENGKKYILTCPIVIPENDTLTIQPGVTIYANQIEGEALPSVTVEGNIYSRGTQSEPVLFTSIPSNPGSWEGLILLNNAEIDYTVVEYAQKGIRCESSGTEIQNSRISNCSLAGIAWEGDEKIASGSIKNCTISENSGFGIVCEASCYDISAAASPVISENLIENNLSGGIRLAAYGTTPYSGVKSRSASVYAEIRNNTIKNNNGYAIVAIARGEYADAIPSDMYRYARVIPVMKQNIISGNTGLVSTEEGYDRSTINIDMINNTILDNGNQLFDYNGGLIYVRNSILWEENASENEIITIPRVSYSISNFKLDGVGNINADPLFTDISNEDYTLSDISPCIDAGNPDLDEDNITWQTDPDDQDADGSRMDMGAIPNLQFPDIPHLLSPANNTSDLDFPLVLYWNVPKSTNSYILEVSLNDQFSSLLLSESGLTDTSYTMTNLLEYTSYYWRVKAVNNLGDSNWSEVFTFQTAQLPPNTPELVTPPNMMVDTDTSLYLNWQKIHNAEHYHVQLSDHDDFSNLIYQNELVGDTLVYVPNLAHLTSYYWRVQAINSAGNSNWSDTLQFTTIIAPPEVPVLFSPANQAVDREVELAFVWNASNHASEYTFQLAGDDLFTKGVFTHDYIQDTLYFKPDLDNSSPYFWRVKALNMNGESNWSEVFSLTTKAPAVGTPILHSPDSSITIEAVSIDLSWSAVDLATRYTIQIADNESFIEPIIDHDAISDTSFQFRGFEFGKDYYWRVRAWNETGSGSWSSVFIFTTQKGTPEMPVLLSPLNQQENLDTTLNLNWGKAIFADYYHVQVATTADFASLSIENLQHEDTSVMIQNLPYNTVYFWRVKGINDLSEGEWSAVYSFTTLNPYPEIPVIISPSNGEQINSTTASLIWEDDNADVTYELQLDDNEDFSSLLIWNTGMGLQLIEIADLDPNTAYFWRVRCQNSYGYSEWTEVYSFTTGDDTSIDGPLSGIQDGIYLGQNYPNPCKNITYIPFSVPRNEGITFKLTDSAGKIIMIRHINFISDDQVLILQLENLAKGVYHYQLSTPNAVQNKQLIIE